MAAPNRSAVTQPCSGRSETDPPSPTGNDSISPRTLRPSKANRQDRTTRNKSQRASKRRSHLRKTTGGNESSPYSSEDGSSSKAGKTKARNLTKAIPSNTKTKPTHFFECNEKSANLPPNLSLGQRGSDEDLRSNKRTNNLRSREKSKSLPKTESPPPMVRTLEELMWQAEEWRKTIKSTAQTAQKGRDLHDTGLPPLHSRRQTNETTPQNTTENPPEDHQTGILQDHNIGYRGTTTSSRTETISREHDRESMIKNDEKLARTSSTTPSYGSWAGDERNNFNWLLESDDDTSLPSKTSDLDRNLHFKDSRCSFLEHSVLSLTRHEAVYPWNRDAVSGCSSAAISRAPSPLLSHDSPPGETNLTPFVLNPVQLECIGDGFGPLRGVDTHEAEMELSSERDSKGQHGSAQTSFANAEVASENRLECGFSAAIEDEPSFLPPVLDLDAASISLPYPNIPDLSSSCIEINLVKHSPSASEYANSEQKDGESITSSGVSPDGEDARKQRISPAVTDTTTVDASHGPAGAMNPTAPEDLSRRENIQLNGTDIGATAATDVAVTLKNQPKTAKVLAMAAVDAANRAKAAAKSAKTCATMARAAGVAVSSMRLTFELEKYSFPAPTSSQSSPQLNEYAQFSPVSKAKSSPSSSVSPLPTIVSMVSTNPFPQMSPTVVASSPQIEVLEASLATSIEITEEPSSTHAGLRAKDLQIDEDSAMTVSTDSLGNVQQVYGYATIMRGSSWNPFASGKHRYCLLDAATRSFHYWKNKKEKDKGQFSKCLHNIVVGNFVLSSKQCAQSHISLSFSGSRNLLILPKSIEDCRHWVRGVKFISRPQPSRTMSTQASSNDFESVASSNTNKFGMSIYSATAPQMERSQKVSSVVSETTDATLAHRASITKLQNDERVQQIQGLSLRPFPVTLTSFPNSFHPRLLNWTPQTISFRTCIRYI